MPKNHQVYRPVEEILRDIKDLPKVAKENPGHPIKTLTGIFEKEFKDQFPDLKGAALKATVDELRGKLKLADTDGNNKINEDEMSRFMKSLGAANADQNTCSMALRKFEKSQSR